MRRADVLAFLHGISIGAAVLLLAMAFGRWLS